MSKSIKSVASTAWAPKEQTDQQVRAPNDRWQGGGTGHRVSSTSAAATFVGIAGSSGEDKVAGRTDPVRVARLRHYFLSRREGRAHVVEALIDIDMLVKPGEFVALVGPSGCGKTTLLNILSGLIPLQCGAVEILGKPPAAARKDVAYMFARDALLPWRTALRNVELGLETLNLDHRQRTERATEILKAVKLDDFIAAYPAQLSHGMRQRVALARTFALPFDVLLMDEPFAALDAHLRIETGDLLLQLWEQDRRAVVFVTHDLHEAIALADRVIVFEPRPGRIRTELEVPFARPRSVEQLQGDPQYHELYRHLWNSMASGSHPSTNVRIDR